MRNLSPAVTGLLVVNAAIFGLGALVPQWDGRLANWFACWFPLHAHAGWWQVVTYMFLHGSFAHILFNMFGLVSFGPLLERRWGAGRFLVFYFLCGIGAALTQLGVEWIEYRSLHQRLLDAGVSAPAIEQMLRTGAYAARYDAPVRSLVDALYRIHTSPMVGASGAIYGILVAFGLTYPNARLALLFVPVPVAAKYVIPILLALDLFSGVTGFSLFGGGIAHFAHLGGALIGFVLMWYWRGRVRASSPFVEAGRG